jgi:hypothetical protein
VPKILGTREFSTNEYPMWIYDVTTAGDPTQLAFLSSSPGDANLTGAQVDAVRAALSAAVEALPPVVSCTETLFAVDNQPPFDEAGLVDIQFRDDEWRVNGFSYDVGGEVMHGGMWLFSASPIDGVLTLGDVDAVVAAVLAAVEDLDGVLTATTAGAGAVTPGTVS